MLCVLGVTLAADLLTRHKMGHRAALGQPNGAFGRASDGSRRSSVATRFSSAGRDFATMLLWLSWLERRSHNPKAASSILASSKALLFGDGHA